MSTRLLVLCVATVMTASARAQSSATPTPTPAAGKPFMFNGTLYTEGTPTTPKKKKKSAGGASAAPQMPKIPGGGGGGGRDQANADDADARGTAAGGSGGGDASSDGSMQDCGTLPASVQKDLDDMLAFRQACPLTQGTAMNKNMAINEYKCPGTPTMYLFDAAGTCLKKMAVTYGAGVDRTTSDTSASGCPNACGDDSKHFTPPGFHITETHIGKNQYGPDNSLGLAGLEGQGSHGRGILIHGANNPGTASSWGCSGVAHANLMYVLNQLGTGALVYNSFDPAQLSAGCSNSKGLSQHDAASCHSDGGGATPAGGGGGSSGPGNTAK